MATAVGLNMKITADTAGIGRGVAKTEQQLNRLSKSASSTAGSLRALVGIEIGSRLAAGFTQAARAALDMASRVTESIAAMDDLSQRTGVSTDALQGFQVAADLAGVQNLEGGLQRLSATLGDAAAGSATAQSAFTNIGLSVEELMGMSPEDQFRAIAAAIAAIPDPAARAAAAMDIFGRTGIELLPLFASNLEEIEARAKRLGIVLSADQVEAITEMDDALLMVRKTFDGIIGQVTANLAPVVTALAEEFLSFVETFEGFSGTTGGSGIADAISNAFLNGAEYIADVLDPWLDYLLTWGDTFAATTSDLGGYFEIFTVAVDILQGAFYTVRTFFNEFLAKLADWAKLLPSLLRPSDETIDAFSDGLRRSAAEDRQKASDAFMGRNPNQPAEGSQRLGNAVRKGREAFDGRDDPARQAQKEADRAAKQAERERAAAGAAALKAAEDARKAEEKRLEAVKKADQEIAKVEEDRANRALEIEGERFDALSRQSNEALNVSDVRSGGISEILRIATGREDPAVEEYRKQLGELKKIDAKLGELRADRVEILGNGARAA